MAKRFRVFVVGYYSPESEAMSHRDLTRLLEDADDHVESESQLPIGHVFRSQNRSGALRRWRPYRVIGHELGGKVVVVEPA